MADYPHHVMKHRVLFSGTPITIRPIRPEDSDMAQGLVRHLSEDSRYSYFLGMLRELPLHKLEYFTRIDYEQHMAFVATVVQDGKEIALELLPVADSEETITVWMARAPLRGERNP